MAKIQAVKCPQCGSPRQTYLGDDKYKCNDCGSTYFIDKEKVEVNVKHTYGPNAPAAETPKVSKGAIIGILVVASLVFTPMIVMSVFSGKKSSAGVYETINKSYYDNTERIFGYVYDNKPVTVVLCSRTYRNGADVQKSMMLKVFDSANKLLKETTIFPKTASANFDEVEEVQLFADGTVWLFSDTKIYRLNTQTMEVEYMNDYFASKYQKLSAGIASVERRYDEDGFELKTNLAEQYFLYPSIELVVNDKERKSISDKYSGKGLNGKEVPAVYYEFSYDYKQEQKKLYKINWMYYKGGPNYLFTPNEERLEDGLSWAKSNYKITDCKELTPARIYFNASVAYGNTDTVVIAYKPTAAKDAKTVVQCLNAQGEILWTVANANIKDNFSDPRYTAHIGNYFMLSDGYSVLALNNKGEQLMTSFFNDDVFSKQSKE